MKKKTAFARLLRLLPPPSPAQGETDLIIQTHDFPDHDAAASAFALGKLLGLKGYTVSLLYRGVIRSFSLKTMIEELRIPLIRIDGMAPEPLRSRPCIVVDGNPANSNARPVTDYLFGIVDHHPQTGIPDCPFADIRTGYGSCAALVADYWEDADLTPERDVATALLMGIEMDTDFLSRRVSKPDIDALHRLFFIGDWEFGTRVIKTSLSKKDIPAFEQAVANSRIYGKLLFALIPLNTTQEVISILADFFLRFREILVTVIIENQGTSRHVSVRSRDASVSAAALIRAALRDIGEGGGHDYMAGGLLNPSAVIGEDDLFRRFTAALDTVEEKK
ncbi:MAG: DHH family phosphoesterase [Treponema sp.]|jgi:nanoRNase/pAp phosphatase (c-di-AMP/oligoRNAs hydrolase)|nr:DHH family phosphoesterase [Treponema sp.]